MAGLGDTIFGQVTQWVNNFQRNAMHMFDGMEVKNYIRLIAVVGAYALLRPYLMKLGEKIQAKQHEKVLDPHEMETAKAAISPNSLRGLVEVPEDSESEGEGEATTKGADWGKKARRRQRQMVRRILEKEEELRREQEENEDDKDIMEYLDDYKEGWDK
jgi:hypothetical protein